MHTFLKMHQKEYGKANNFMIKKVKVVKEIIKVNLW
jgi:hypothetical protein